MHNDHGAKDAMRQRKKLGEMLVLAGVLDQGKLDKALVEHKKKNMRLGQYLVRSGIVQEKAFIEVISKQLKLDIYTASEYPLDPSLASLAPEEMARHHQFVPLKKQGQLLWVAMLDPTDMIAMDVITETVRMDVEPVLCMEEEFHRLAQTLYGQRLEHSSDDILKDLEESSANEEEVEAQVEDRTLNVDSLQNMAQDAPVVRLLNSILVQALNKKSSDVHLSPGKDKVSLRVRVDGALVELMPPPKSVFLPLVSRLKLLSGMDISISRIPQDGRFSFRTRDKEVSVRASSIPTIHGEKIVLRILEQSGTPRSLDQLGLREDEKRKIESAVQKPYGMILATGPTGSGKTTLLYSILSKVNQPDVNVITLEDPVEYQMDGVAQIQLNRKAGMTFASGLRAILRQDPDVIMVGEIRDQETANIAVESALTGHKVLSTLHTNDAAGAVTRFTEMGIEHFLISSTVLVVVAQRLIRRLCPECREPYEASAELLKAMGVKPKEEGRTLYRAKGCPQCNNNGYKGRVGVYEVLEIDAMAQDLILRRASSTEIKRTMVAAGAMRTLKMDGALKALEGITSFEEFIKVAAN